MSHSIWALCEHWSHVCVLQGSGNVILQRAADGTPLQWFVAEDAEIVSQV